MKKFKFKISVIIPVYNVYDYLEETIKSVINQTIGFKKNIQMILVNDGSLDNSEEVCLKYRDMYPDNVVYVKQENQGVSVARNKGLEYAEGEYINFLDSDDKWDRNAFKKGVLMLDSNKDVDVVAFRIKFFEAQTGYHFLDYKFDKDKVIDINVDYDHVFLHMPTSLIRFSAIEDIRFDSKLKISEDSKFVTEIVLKKGKIGHIASCNYYYRKRFSQSSAIQTSKNNLSWYFDTPEYCYQYLCDLSIKKFGKVIPYIQYFLVYDLQWRLFIEKTSCLDDKKIKKYISKLRELLDYVDDKIIINFNFTFKYQNYYFLKLKYNNKEKLAIKDGKVYFKDIYFCDMKDIDFRIDNIKIVDEKLVVYGQLFDVFDFDKLYLVDQNNNKYEFSFYDLDSHNEKFICIDSKYGYKKVGIYLKIDLKNITSLSAFGSIKKDMYQLKPIFSYNANLNNNFASLFLTSDKYLLKYNKKSESLLVCKNKFSKRFEFECKAIFNLIRKKKIKSLFLREVAKLCRGFKVREIWIISDRIQVAGDNGEAFFKYVMENELNPDIKYYFAISKKSRDYKKISEYYSNVIDPNSFRYKILFLISDKIISAHADDYVINPFGRGKKFLSDLYNFKYVFLQHGVINNDLSPWLNVNSKDIDMFVTTTKDEYNSILDCRYNYDKDVVKLTGLPRHDLLLNKDVELKKQIVIMPTWRTSLVSPIDRKTGKRLYDAKFKETEYFKFYNNLINDKRILNAAKKYDYKVRFIPHTNMLQQISDFDQNDVVEIVKSNFVYRDEFKSNKLLVTDYSSVFFDFCYLRKPIIYAHFDRDEFFEQQIYDRGYFDYENNGFGPVCRNYEDTVKAIVKLLKNDCCIDSKYKTRIDDCFEYCDQNNSKRVYDEIRKL